MTRTPAHLPRHHPAPAPVPTEAPARVVALVPAHNEEALIAVSVRSLLEQTHPVERIIVIADNCTDDTAGVVERNFDDDRVVVLETVGNRHRKAGALNHALSHADLDGIDVVVECDADTEIHPSFVAEAVAEFAADARLGGIGARFVPRPLPADAGRVARLLWHLQRHEYARDDSQRVERQWSVSVLSGTASAFRLDALREADGWDRRSIVEDYALSIDLRELGWRTSAGARTFCWTDVPLTIGELWRQRLRWYGGTMVELDRRADAEATRFDRFQVMLFELMLVMQVWFLVMLAVTLVVAGGIGVAWWGLLLPIVVFADRLHRLRYLPGRSASDVALALSPLPDLYQLWRQAVWVRAGRLAHKEALAWQ